MAIGVEGPRAPIPRRVLSAQPRAAALAGRLRAVFGFGAEDDEDLAGRQRPGPGAPSFLTATSGDGRSAVYRALMLGAGLMTMCQSAVVRA